MEDAVQAVAQTHLLLFGFDVDVGRIDGERAREDHFEYLGDAVRALHRSHRFDGAADVSDRLYLGDGLLELFRRNVEDALLRLYGEREVLIVLPRAIERHARDHELFYLIAGCFQVRDDVGKLGVLGRTDGERELFADDLERGRFGRACGLFRYETKSVGIDGNTGEIGIRYLVLAGEHDRQLFLLFALEFLDMEIARVGKRHFGIIAYGICVFSS